MADKGKKGRISRAEEKYVLERAASVPVAEIARETGRSEATIKDILSRNSSGPTPTAPEKKVDGEANTLRKELRSSDDYERLKTQFNDKELKYFEATYVSLMLQFKGDILPTERPQVFQLITLQILMGRNLESRSKAVKDIERLEGELSRVVAAFGGDEEAIPPAHLARLRALREDIGRAQEAEREWTSEYVKLHDKHESVLKSLKGTRDQRVKQIADSRVTFLGLVKALQERDIAEAEGREMELVRMAAESTYSKLGNLHEFSDGQWDRPILSPETVSQDGPEGDPPE